MKALIIGVVIVVLIIIGAVVLPKYGKKDETGIRSLKVGIAPYQDMAMLINPEQKKLEEKYDLKLDLVTLAWEDLTPAVSSAAEPVDIAFASLTQFVTNERNINRNTDDPLMFVYPAYIFLGGSFVSFNPDVETITKNDLDNKEKLQKFLTHSFAAESKSQYEQMLFMLAKKAEVDFSTVKLTNIGAGDGLLAAINGSVDATSAGLTQRNEAMQKGGRVVLDSADLDSVDIAGFVVKKSMLDAKRDEIEDFIRVWYDSLDYVLSDPDNRSADSIAYLNEQSSTKYTTETFKQALSHEVFPRSIKEVQQKLLNADAEYDFKRAKDSLIEFLLANKVISEPPHNITLLNIAL